MSEEAFKHLETQHEDALQECEHAKTEAVEQFR